VISYLDRSWEKVSNKQNKGRTRIMVREEIRELQTSVQSMEGNSLPEISSEMQEKALREHINLL
jgi:hypothetical protein